MYRQSEGSKVVKWLLIGISFVFVFLMLILPLITVVIESLKQGGRSISKPSPTNIR